MPVTILQLETVKQGGGNIKLITNRVTVKSACASAVLHLYKYCQLIVSEGQIIMQYMSVNYKITIYSVHVNLIIIIIIIIIIIMIIIIS